ncbi:unnamed protein product [Prorocentrum cordatum]|uniref:Uncharacterized protein n=1 Tax=Prorocentrum cordatum TaxID=2364126 RepID=A0ABN9R8R0_9DINO|nr:unnamed protein product [Polarella glacialis]
MVAAGYLHTALLRSDGTAVASGANRAGQCNVPALDGGLSYTQVAAGREHTALLRSDGTAVAFGGNRSGQCNVPALDGGLSYTQVAAGREHTALLRSDGTAVAFGLNYAGQCNVLALDGGLTYTARLLVGATLLLQASLDGGAVRFLTLGGVERCWVRAAPGAPLAGVRDWLAGELGAGRLDPGLGRADAALPGGRLLSGASAGETVADAFALAQGSPARGLARVAWPSARAGPAPAGCPRVPHGHSAGGGESRASRIAGRGHAGPRASRPRPRMVAAGYLHTALLRSDGTAVASGANRAGQCNVPALDGGLSYTQVAAGSAHTALLRSDGTAVAFGWNHGGQCNVPALDGGLSYTHYTEVAAGTCPPALLSSDGTGRGLRLESTASSATCRAGRWPSYTQVAAGREHTALLRSDGTAVAFGGNRSGQCNVPALDGGLSYTQVAAGREHTALLRSDGTAVAFGGNRSGQCNVPALDGGLSYTQVAAGREHTALLRSDGTAVAFGLNYAGQCNVLALDGGLTYTARLLVGATLLLQASLDGGAVRFLTLGGVERCWVRAAPGAPLAGVRDWLAGELGAGRLDPGLGRADAALPGGRLLSGASAGETVADAFAL